MRLPEPPSGLPRDSEPTCFNLHQTYEWAQALLFTFYIAIASFYCVWSASAFFLMKLRGGVEYKSTSIIIYLSPVFHSLLLSSHRFPNEHWQGYVYLLWQIIQCVVGLALIASLWEWQEEEIQFAGWLLNFGCLIVATLLFHAHNPYEAHSWAAFGSALSRLVFWTPILSNAVFMFKHLYRNWKDSSTDSIIRRRA